MCVECRAGPKAPGARCFECENGEMQVASMAACQCYDCAHDLRFAYALTDRTRLLSYSQPRHHGVGWCHLKGCSQPWHIMRGHPRSGARVAAASLPPRSQPAASGGLVDRTSSLMATPSPPRNHVRVTHPSPPSLHTSEPPLSAGGPPVWTHPAPPHRQHPQSCSAGSPSARTWASA